MSVNSFSTNMKLELRRRLWDVVISGIVLFLFIAVGGFLALSSVENSNAIAPIKGWELLDKKLAAMNLFIGLHSIVPVLTVILAVLLAMSGFAYLDSRQELDFYESQPVSRKMRFITVFLSGILIYAMTSGAVRLFAVIMSVIMRAMSLSFLLQCIIQYLRELVLFLGVYSISTLSMMLCGNILIALLGTGVLLSYEGWVRLLRMLFMNSFYKTYVSIVENELGGFISSPVYYYISGLTVTSEYNSIYKSAEAQRFIKEGLSGMLMEDMKGLFLSVILLSLAYIAYKLRKNEMAGQAVVFKTMQKLIKLAIAIPGALSIALFSGAIMDFSETALTTGIMLGLCVLAVVLLCCLMELIYSFRFKAILSHPGELFAAALISLMLLCFYRFDISGYDRYVPRAEDISSAIFKVGYRGNTNIYPDEHGFLNSIDYKKALENGVKEPELLSMVTELAEEGQEYYYELSRRPDYLRREDNGGYHTEVYYRLKNGKYRARQFVLPYNVSAESMDRLTGSDEYIETVWLLSGYPFSEGHGEYCRLQYETAYRSTEWMNMSDSMMDEFKKAYTADIRQYSYSFAQKSDSIGSISISSSPTPEDNYYHGYSKIDMPLEQYLRLEREKQNLPESFMNYQVYPSYRNTIDFLKRYDIFLEAKPELEDIASAEISLYLDTGDIADKPMAIMEWDEEDVEKGLRKIELISSEEIVKAMSLAQWDNAWVDSFYNPDNYEKDVVLSIKTKSYSEFFEGYDSYNSRDREAQYIFRKGQLPEEFKDKLGMS